MTKREQNLIFLMAVIIIVLGGFKLLIEPAQEKTDALENQYNNLSMEQSTTQIKIAKLPDLEESYELLYEELEQSRELIDPYQEDEQVNRRFLTLASDNEAVLNAYALTHVELSTYEGKNVYPSENLMAKAFSLGYAASFEEFLGILEDFQKSTDAVITTLSYNGATELSLLEQELDISTTTFTINGQVYMDLKETVLE